jgi:hypothetical protein
MVHKPTHVSTSCPDLIMLQELVHHIWGLQTLSVTLLHRQASLNKPSGGCADRLLFAPVKAGDDRDMVTAAGCLCTAAGVTSRTRKPQEVQKDMAHQQETVDGSTGARRKVHTQRSHASMQGDVLANVASRPAGCVLQEDMRRLVHITSNDGAACFHINDLVAALTTQAVPPHTFVSHTLCGAAPHTFPHTSLTFPIPHDL